MTNRIKATIRRREVLSHEIELSMVDEDDKDYEQHICSIYVDEIEMTEDFVKYLYKEIEEKEGK